MNHPNWNTSPVRLPVGLRERYTVFGNPIGVGGFGTVYRAKEISTGKLYAVKIVEYSDRAGLDLVLREIDLQDVLSHPNIVELRDSGHDVQNGTVFLVLTLCQDGDLNQKIQLHVKDRTYFPESEIWSIFAQVVKGLHYLHTAPDPKKVAGRYGMWTDRTGVEYALLHRDIKAANVLLDGQTARLADFGLGRLMDYQQQFSTQAGTPPYFPPEIVACKKYGRGVDLWCLGSLLFEMATLRRPFVTQHVHRGVTQATHKIPPMGTRYSLTLKAMVRALLSFEPDNRPPTEQLLQNPKIILGLRSLTLPLPIPIPVPALPLHRPQAQKKRVRSVENETVEVQPMAKKRDVLGAARAEVGWARWAVRGLAQLMVDAGEVFVFVGQGVVRICDDT